MNVYRKDDYFLIFMCFIGTVVAWYSLWRPGSFLCPDHHRSRLLGSTRGRRNTSITLRHCSFSICCFLAKNRFGGWWTFAGSRVHQSLRVCTRNPLAPHPPVFLRVARPPVGFGACIRVSAWSAPCIPGSFWPCFVTFIAWEIAIFSPNVPYQMTFLFFVFCARLLN